LRGAERLVDRPAVALTARDRPHPSDLSLFDIARTVDAERQCCQFLRFTLTVEPGGGAIQLDLTGPPGTREFVSALVGL
jgi:hypothetical protein